VPAPATPAPAASGNTTIAPQQAPLAAPQTPAQTITEQAPPLSPGHSWSLLSLILSVAAVLVAAMLLVLKRMRKRGARLLAVIFGILTPVVWLILDWPLQTMAWVNQSTIIVAIVFAVSLASILVYNARKRDADDWGSSEKVFNH